jgi:hypothetical protein
MGRAFGTKFNTLLCQATLPLIGKQRRNGMSWDVLVMRFPEGFDGDFDNIPDGWKPEELFTHDFFIKEVKKIFPNINDADEDWLFLNKETFSIEFNIGKDDPISDIMLHIRGGDEAIKAIAILCEKLNLQALDTTDCKLIDFNKETNDGFTQWREYNNRVIKFPLSGLR